MAWMLCRGLASTLGSQSCTVWLPLPASSTVPSGDQETQVTGAVWSLSVRSSLPPLASHMHTVWSLLAVASVLLSRVHETALTAAVCPSKLRSILAVKLSHSEILLVPIPSTNGRP